MERNEIKKDSLSEKDAWAKWEKGYMDRTHKMKGTKHERVLTPEDNRKEMEMERGEFMYDKNKGQIRLRKTDDADIPIERRTSRVNELKPSGVVPAKTAPGSPPPRPMTHRERNLMHKTQSVTDKAIREQEYPGKVGVDLGVIKKKSALNMIGIGVSRNSRCWEGYEPTPGVKPYAKGSCRKK
jgi:hypothetical protein